MVIIIFFLMRYNLFLIIIPKMVAPISCQEMHSALDTLFNGRNMLVASSGTALPCVSVFPALFSVINSKWFINIGYPLILCCLLKGERRES